MEVIFNGRLLTQAHLDLLVPLLNEGLSERELKGRAAKSFEQAGIPIPPLEVGQVVYWKAPTGKDRGKILEIVKRSGQIKVESKLRGRPVTIKESEVRVDADV